MTIKKRPLDESLRQRMATLIQLSATSWLNMDTVTVIRHEGEQWQVWVAAQEPPLQLPPEETATIAAYVRLHTYHRAYYESQRQPS